MVEKNSHSFRIEEDYCDWELAIDGIKSVTAELKKMREIPMSLDGFSQKLKAAAQKICIEDGYCGKNEKRDKNKTQHQRID